MTVTVTVIATALLITAQLLLLVTGTLSNGGHDQGSNITLTVFDSFTNFNRTYPAHTAYRGSLLGAMKRLQAADPSFTFTTTENFDYGPYLEGVNGLAAHDNVYWEILVEYKNGTKIRTNVGIGCYIPNPNERIILKFTKWPGSSDSWETEVRQTPFNPLNHKVSVTHWLPRFLLSIG